MKGFDALTITTHTVSDRFWLVRDLRFIGDEMGGNPKARASISAQILEEAAVTTDKYEVPEVKIVLQMIRNAVDLWDEWKAIR